MPFILPDLHNKLSNEFTDRKLKSCNAVKKIKIYILQNAELQQMQQKQKWTSMIQ
jgi:hypothetical protein